MTSEREEFEDIGRRLYGRSPDGWGWESEMARRTGFPLRTIQSWGKSAPMNRGVLSLLRQLDDVTARLAGPSPESDR